MKKPLIEVKNLEIEFFLKNGNLRACDNVSFTIYENEVVGIIGESGSGKSTLASGILNLVNTPGKIVGGEVYYYENGKKIDLLALDTILLMLSEYMMILIIIDGKRLQQYFRQHKML